MRAIRCLFTEQIRPRLEVFDIFLLALALVALWIIFG